MPHINVKYFSLLTEEAKSKLVVALTQAVTDVFQCDEQLFQ